MDILGRLCRRIRTARPAWRLLAARRRTGWVLGAPQRGESMVSDHRSDICARHSMLLVWCWLEEMGRYSLRCRVIRANLHVCNGPLRLDVLRERPNRRSWTWPHELPAKSCRLMASQSNLPETVSREFQHGNSTGHPLSESVDLTVSATLHGSLDK